MRLNQRAFSNESFDGIEHTGLTGFHLSHRPACLGTVYGELEDSFVCRNIGNAIRLARAPFGATPHTMQDQAGAAVASSDHHA